MTTNAAKIISIAVFLLFMQGCKITQIVPANGAMVSRTGAHNCASGQTCVIDVVSGSVFSDTFTATPDAGYRFAGWKKQSGYLCGGNKTPCAVEGLTANFTVLDANVFLEPIFEKIDLLKFLPATTRGVFQIDPGATGALDTSVTSTAWGSGPLQILQQYSAGMDIAGNAQRLVLAQISGTPDQFILLAKLDSSNVETLSAGLSLTAVGAYRGYQRWSIVGTDLQLARIDSLTLALAPQAALQQALDVYEGAGAAIGTGPLGTYLAGLNVGQPNNVVYGLPALYGTVAAPGSGTASLSQARVVSASFGIQSGVLSGGLAFYSDNAQSYRTKLLAQLSGTPATANPAPAIVSYGNITSVNLAGLSADEDILPLLKTLFLEMDAVDYTAAVVHGGNPPFLNFNVGGSPNSIFINFEFKDEAARQAFEADHLPAGITLAPIRVLAGEEPRYFLVLNIYQSSGGLVEGARAEWSVFVNDPVTGAPRFTVVQAAAAGISADPVNLLTSAEPVTHVLDQAPEPDAIVSYVGVVDPGTGVETEYFSSRINAPQPPVSSNARLAREFVVANDYIFWGNLVADRGLYNSTFHSREVVLIDANDFTVADNSRWKDYINAAPVHTMVYQNPLDLVVSPWWNLDATYLAVTPAHRTALINFKNGFYPSTVQAEAKAAIRGQKAVLSPVTTGVSVPTARYHFTLLDPVGLLAAVEAADRTPVTVKLFEDDAAAEHYLTLLVYRREKDPCGIRAEWVTYVEGPDGRPTTLRLDAVAAESCLNPVSLMTVATDLTQSIAGGSLSTQIVSPFARFAATADLSLVDGPLVGQDWVEAGDRVCSLNGVCDDFYYDGQLLLAPAQRVGSSGVLIQEMATPWDTYIDKNAVRVDVRNSPALQAIKPWRNLRSFAADVPAP
jgi:Divergent InlB B-repeat domain